MRRMTLLALIIGLTMGPGCARIAVKRGLRVEPVEAAQSVVKVVGQGYQLRGRRDGQVVRVQVAQVSYCQHNQTQRAKGFRVTERRAVGPGLAMEWIMGGVITLTGAGLITYNQLNPPQVAEGELAVSSTRTWLYSGAIVAAGLGLLTAAFFQQRSLGRSEVAIGMKTLRKQGRVRPCRAKKATGGRLRLTLDSGLQLETDVGPDGMASFALPADIEQRLKTDGRRATLEAMGDWRSQRRLSL
ncbi:MAG: hypothetical protein KC502_15600 [Myxococcales bacterium]|nr:hypothetical protein [Myxococcales bacterium]